MAGHVEKFRFRSRIRTISVLEWFALYAVCFVLFLIIGQSVADTGFLFSQAFLVALLVSALYEMFTAMGKTSLGVSQNGLHFEHARVGPQLIAFSDIRSFEIALNKSILGREHSFVNYTNAQGVAVSHDLMLHRMPKAEAERFVAVCKTYKPGLLAPWQDQLEQYKEAQT